MIVTWRRVAAVSGAAVVAIATTVGYTAAAQDTARATTSPPTQPPARICGDTALLAGPATAPAGAVTIDPAIDRDAKLKTDANPAGTTFWFAPGTHTLGTGEFGQVIPKEGNTYLGGPGAILDGQKANRYAFTQHATNVTIKHLTIRNFGADGANRNEGVVNHDSATGWVVEANTITLNAGAGLMVGNDNILRNNCIKDNQQYGFNAYKRGGVTNVTMHQNEITGNNTYDWDTKVPGCGCTGGGKFWDVNGAAVTNNWVHHNKSTGLWADTNNVGFRIEGNYIEENDAHGIFYEISYNAVIKNNTLRRNNLVRGQQRQANNSTFPVGAIYLSEAGGEPRVNGGVYGTLEVTGNLMEDNWGGVILWENADRFCNSPANTSANYCTELVADKTQCSQPGIATEPLYGDCRWKTNNVKVHGNEFRIDKAAIGCTYAYCGLQAVISNYGTYPDWSPYKARVIQDAITFQQNNVFTNNKYVGDWKFNPYEQKRLLSWEQWRAAPYNQDTGSRYNEPEPVAPNVLDAETATLDTTTGRWVNWYSVDRTRSTEQAHGGAASLKATVTAKYGWGVQLNNYPGFATTAGPRTVSYWAMAGTPGVEGATVTMVVHWKDATGATISATSLPSPALSTAWQQAQVTVEAPANTVTAYVQLKGNHQINDVVYFDDFYVG